MVDRTRNQDFLRAYPTSIGYAGDAAPTLENIAAIHAHHIRRVAATA